MHMKVQELVSMHRDMMCEHANMMCELVMKQIRVLCVCVYMYIRMYSHSYCACYRACYIYKCTCTMLVCEINDCHVTNGNRI